jgi:hypothetical protein
MGSLSHASEQIFDIIIWLSFDDSDFMHYAYFIV